jgi:ABC-type dipeptide/oligopeptide/nickel transport system permease subunit
VAPWARPCRVIFVTCMCFTLLSDGLRQALDIPR